MKPKDRQRCLESILKGNLASADLEIEELDNLAWMRNSRFVQINYD
jgi:hypothetical protein